MIRVLLLAATILVAPAWAAEPATGSGAADADALAKKLSNPVAALISVPLQLNWDTGLGPSGDGDRTTLNIQPVIPVSLSEDWNLISRTVLPVLWQDDVVPGAGSQSGLGDTVQSLFFSPKAPTESGWIWGVGPALLVPTGGSDFTADQWAVGPTAVVLKQTAAGWTYGMLVNQLWAVSNSGSLPDVDATFVQPFVSLALGRGRTVSLNTEATYDRNAGQWTVPVNAAYSQVLKLGGQLISVAGGVRTYLDGPRGGPDWGLRLNVTLLYPR